MIIPIVIHLLVNLLVILFIYKFPEVTLTDDAVIFGMIFMFSFIPFINVFLLLVIIGMLIYEYRK